LQKLFTSDTYYQVKFQDPILSGISVAVTSEACTAVTMKSLKVEIKKTWQQYNLPVEFHES